MRIMIVDDHELFRNGLRFQIAAIDAASEIVEADTFSGALGFVESGTHFDKVFLDVAIPDELTWRDALLRFREESEVTDVVIMSGGDDTSLMRSAIDLGAVAYIPKSLKGDVLESALRLVLSGDFSILPKVARAAATRPSFTPLSGLERGPASSSGSDLSLTTRQREVLEHINAGLSNRRIADLMGLSEATIKMHVGRLFKVLGAESRTDALAVARRSGLL